MPITSTSPGAFTHTMEALLRVQLPGYEQHASLFRDVLTSVENRAAPATLAEETQAAARRGTFDRVYAALQPRHQTLDTEERYALWTLKGVGEVFKAGTPTDFDQVATAVHAWQDANRARLTSELGDPQEPRIDDLQADLFRELGYIGDDRLQAGYVHDEDRTRIARFIADGCHRFDIVAISNCSRKDNAQGEEFVLVNGTHKDGDDRAFLVRLQPLLALRTRVTAKQLQTEARLYGPR